MSQNRVPRTGSPKLHIHHYPSRTMGTSMSLLRLQHANGIFLYPNTTQKRSLLPGAFYKRKKGIATILSFDKDAINCNKRG